MYVHAFGVPFRFEEFNQRNFDTQEAVLLKNLQA